MAIFHFHTKPIKRSAGRSATASSAYRAGCKIKDERTGNTFDYSKRSGVVFSKCLLSTADGIQELDRNELWNLAEKSEKRKDGRTAREIVVNIPHELSEEKRIKLIDDFAIELSEKLGVAVDYAIHLPDKEGDQRNHHAHIMITTRNATYENNELKLHDKTKLELSNTKLKKLGLPKTQEQIKELRETWANFTNKALEKNNIDARIDHRSYAEQNKDQLPTIKLGWKASDMERKGIATDRGDINRSIKADNERIDELKKEIKLDTAIASADSTNPFFGIPKPEPKPKKPEPEEVEEIEDRKTKTLTAIEKADSTNPFPVYIDEKLKETKEQNSHLLNETVITPEPEQEQSNDYKPTFKP